MENSISDITTKITEVSTSVDALWVLIAGILVMFMQAGFALVEAGFTRAKNTVNIIMKNLMDFSVGTLVFWFIGYSIMFGDDNGGFIGTLDFGFMSDYGNSIPDYAMLFFQTVFAATAATIVSGAVAERTKFSAYLIFSFVITLVIYPISGHWVWGGGWLSKLSTPFHDFAGSTVVHSVGAWVGLVGAIMVGPRIGKFNGKSNAIPGHNLAMGALGVFILWFGWFGFNPGSQMAASGLENSKAISSIFISTNISAASATVVAMIISWIRYKRPSLSMTLNGTLAGLVAITAGCDIVSPAGAAAIGAMAGVALIFSVELFDKVLKIDDPVGAISVHGVCGALGTIMVGIFSTKGGVIYGGGLALLGSQIIGVLAIAIWAVTIGLVLFTSIKLTLGLRVEKRLEEEGLDIYEHGESAYL